MPIAGQQALASYVQNGGAYLGSEWLSFEASSHPLLRDLILFDYGGFAYDTVTYTAVAAQAGHPVLANVPSPFSFNGGRAFATAHTFSTNPVTVLMSDQGNSAAVAVRDVGAGRVVGFNHSGNDGGSLADTNVRQLFVDGVRWAARVGSGGATINVTNVAPSATLTTRRPGHRTHPVTLTFSNVTDPSTADTAAGFRYSFATSTSGLATSYATASTSRLGRSRRSTTNVLFYTRVFDKDGGFRDYPTVVTVTNVAPTATITNSGPVGEDSP